MTYAAFIKKEVKDIWLDKAYETINLNNELRMTLLIKDANRNPILNDLKKYFEIWGEDVMTFLYTVVQESEKNKQKKGKKEEPAADKDEEAPQYIDKKINTA